MTQTAAQSELTDIPAMMAEMGAQARNAYEALATAEAAAKTLALHRAAQALRASQQRILDANAQDMAYAQDKNLSAALLDRLALDDARIEAMAAALETIAQYPDPVGKELGAWDGAGNGLHIRKVSVPLGVIGIIYESRPNVTADAAALCIKSGNAAILRAGSECLNSAEAITACLHEGLRAANLPEQAVQLVPTRERAAVGEMLQMIGVIDVIVPRGGKSLTERIAHESRIPTIQHLDGNCHSYVHHSADIDQAVAVVTNAKMRRTGICGATESLVVDEAIIDRFLPRLADHLLAKGCEIRGDARAQSADDRINAAHKEDWGIEYLDAILSVKTVRDLDEAISHINRYSSHHTDAILAQDSEAQMRFSKQVDSAIVMVNSSTQFADGGEFGMGAEIGISTGRLHARGPVGCEQLTTYKYIVASDGAIRA